MIRMLAEAVFGDTKGLSGKSACMVGTELLEGRIRACRESFQQARCVLGSPML